MANDATLYRLALDMAIRNADGNIDVAIRRMSKMACADAHLYGYIGHEVKITDIERVCAETLSENPGLDEQLLVGEALQRVKKHSQGKYVRH